MSAAAVEYDPTRDSRHPDARAARDQAAWLSRLELDERSPRTVYDYQWATDVLLGTFPSRAFDEFSEDDCSYVLRRWKGDTRRTRQAGFNSWFSWGIDTGRLTVNPLDRIKAPKRKGQRYIETFTEAEAAALTSLPSPDGILMLILLEAGLRKGEARRLQWRRCLLDQRQIVIIDGKGGKDRVVPMTRRLTKALAAVSLLEALGPNDYLWYTRPGGKKMRRHVEMGETSFHVWWSRACEAAGVVYIPRKQGRPDSEGRGNPHVTRHTFATNWLRRGGGLLTLSRVLGHSSIKTTADLYGHLDTRDIIADIELIEAGL